MNPSELAVIASALDVTGPSKSGPSAVGSGQRRSRVLKGRIFDPTRFAAFPTPPARRTPGPDDLVVLGRAVQILRELGESPVARNELAQILDYWEV